MKYLIAMLLLLATPSFSAQIFVKSGEHGSFTRLAMELPKNTTALIEKIDEGYEISLNGQPLTFDIKSVYQRINHDRFKDIRVDSRTGKLILTFDCACKLVSELLENSFLILDLHDKKHTTAGSSEIEYSFDWKNSPLDFDNQSMKISNKYNDKIGTKNLTKSHEILSKELAKGLSSGVLEISGRRTFQTKIRSAEENFMNADKFITINRDGEPSTNDEICPPQTDYEIWNWSANDITPVNFTENADATAPDTDEFDRDTILNLVKSNVYKSFGAEARQLLSGLPEGKIAAPSLWFLSYIVDGDTPPENILRNKQLCGGVIALWSILAANKKDDLQGVNIDGAIQAFLLLPEHLQILHSQKLVGFLISGGQSAAAEMIAAAAERKPGATHATAPIIRAEVSLSLDDPSAAEQTLDSISETKISVDSLIVKIDASLADRSMPDLKDIETLESLFFSESHGPDGEKLLRALAIGKALTGDFQRATHLSKQSSSVFEEIWGLLITQGQDGDFLREISDLTDNEIGKLTPNLREKTSQRLIDLGLPALAANWRPQESRNSVLAAEIFLGLEEFDSAINQLANEKSDVAADIRTQALTAMGRYGEAAELLKMLGNSTEATRVAKWAKNWEATVDDTDETWAKVALHSVASASDQGGTLKGAEKAANLAAQAAKEINSLLELTGID